MPPKPKKKDPPKKGPEPPHQNDSETPPPNWPPLRPLIPASDLHLEQLLKDQIYIIRNLLPASLCKTYVSFLSTLPLTTTPKLPKRGDAVRANDRFQINDPGFAEKLWSSTALKELVSNSEDEEDEEVSTREMLWGGDVLGLNPNIRIYRYTPGQFFAPHYDDSNSLLFTPSASPSPSPAPVPAKTTWTLLIYLTTCTGGETVFYPDRTRSNPNPEPLAVGLEVGMALLHRHGEKCLIHEGREVESGEKWVIRSDLVVGRRKGR